MCNTQRNEVSCRQHFPLKRKERRRSTWQTQETSQQSLWTKPDKNRASNNYRRHICAILLSVFGACDFPWHKLRLPSWKLHLAQSYREQSSPLNLPNEKQIIILYTTLINTAR